LEINTKIIEIIMRERERENEMKVKMLVISEGRHHHHHHHHHHNSDMRGFDACLCSVLYLSSCPSFGSLEELCNVFVLDEHTRWENI